MATKPIAISGIVPSNDVDFTVIEAAYYAGQGAKKLAEVLRETMSPIKGDAKKQARYEGMLKKIATVDDKREKVRDLPEERIRTYNALAKAWQDMKKKKKAASLVWIARKVEELQKLRKQLEEGDAEEMGIKDIPKCTAAIDAAIAAFKTSMA